MDDIQADALQTLALELKRPGSGIRNVDDAPRHYRAPVIDAYHHRPTVSQVRYAYPAP
jgi:hypothetical protein